MSVYDIPILWSTLLRNTVYCSGQVRHHINTCLVTKGRRIHFGSILIDLLCARQKLAPSAKAELK